MVQEELTFDAHFPKHAIRGFLSTISHKIFETNPSFRVKKRTTGKV